ncbi:hypothetical protein GGI03_002340 [Coemansia sp. RSA 2337]|nr:hypothetical protein GGI14_000588 [Coemansia sp. S680]KAJ2023206.1 hypothetical protein H4S03_009372 [Coemansia sp. S3946]KAJ2045034.1 hypothetical protein GGI08_006927 [Coemansia sp. S2]KAJ2466022.1 hypothetical protein GGI03_002340 [Coemansia sp. RSA 2337]
MYFSTPKPGSQTRTAPHGMVSVSRPALPLQRPSSRQGYMKEYTPVSYQHYLPTPTDDYVSEEERRHRLSYIGPDHASSPSGAYSHMSLSEKVREANYALVHSWGKFLVGGVIRELSDKTSLMHTIRLVSLIDIPADFCISPADEPLGPSSDPTRVIVIVSPSGLIVDTGIFDFDGPIFYKGCVVCNHYVPATLTTT